MNDFYSDWCAKCMRRSECDNIAMTKGYDGRATYENTQPEYCLNYAFDDTCWYLAMFGSGATHKPWFYADADNTIPMVFHTREEAQEMYDHLNTVTWPGRLTNQVWIQRATEHELGGQYRIKYHRGDGNG